MFGFVSRDKQSESSACHVFQYDKSTAPIANAFGYVAQAEAHMGLSGAISLAGRSGAMAAMAAVVSAVLLHSTSFLFLKSNRQSCL